MQISRLLQILREFASDPILSDYVIDAVWQGMDAIKAIFTSVNFLIVYGLAKQLVDELSVLFSINQPILICM